MSGDYSDVISELDQFTPVEVAAQCWCDPRTSHLVMEPALALVFAEKLAGARQQRNNWVNTAAQHHRNEQYYRCLVVQAGEAIGPEAYVCDDGSTVPDVLCAKVPELVRALATRHEAGSL